MSIKNVKLRFNLNKENDRKAYEYLQNAEISYSKAVISAICGYMELSQIKENEDSFLERVIAAIREELRGFNPLGSFLQFVQQSTSQKLPAEKEDTDKAETEETMIGFLDSF